MPLVALLVWKMGNDLADRHEEKERLGFDFVGKTSSDQQQPAASSDAGSVSVSVSLSKFVTGEEGRCAASELCEIAPPHRARSDLISRRRCGGGRALLATPERRYLCS